MKQEPERPGQGAAGSAIAEAASGPRPWPGAAARRAVLGLFVAALAAAAVWSVQRGHGVAEVGVALLAGLGALAVLFQGMRGKGAVAVALLLVVPLFFRVGGGRLIDLPESSFSRLDGQTLPLGGALAVLIGVGLLFRGGFAALDRHRPVLVTIGIFALSGLALLAVGIAEHGASVNPLLYFQLTIPLFAILPGLYAADRPEAIRRLVTLVKWGLLLSCLAILLQTVVARGPGGLFGEPLLVRFGPLNIYQEADYVPFVFAIALLFVTITETHVRRLAWHDPVYIGIVGLTLLGLYSRGAILTVAVGLAAAIVLARREYRGGMMKLAAVFALIYVLGTLLGMNGVQRLNASLGMIGGSTAASVTESSAPANAAGPDQTPSVFEQDRSLRNRYLGLRQALAHLRHHPVTGSAFGRPTIPAELAQDPLFTAKRQFQYLGVSEFGSPHNQYLDITLRGGLLWLAAFLALVFTVAWRLWKAGRTTGSPVAAGVRLAVLCLLLSTMLASNFYQHNFAQPFSGFFLWYLIGVALAVRTSPGPDDRTSTA